MTTEISTISTLFPTKMTRIGGENVQTISARTIHEYLESGQDFTNWIKARIEKYGFVSGQDFSHYKIVDGDNSSRFSSAEYEITLDMAKELGMVEGNAKGQEIRQYFIAAEKEMRRLQVENTKLLEKQTKTLQIENKALTRKNDELDDRNEYLEGKKTLLIDGHLEKCLREELTAERTERQRLEDQMFLDECGSTSLDVKACVRFVKQRMKAIDKHLKDLEKFAKKSEMSSTLEDYTDRIRSELSFYRNW